MLGCWLLRPSGVYDLHPFISNLIDKLETDCRGFKPVPTVAFHGRADKFAPYEGGRSPITPRQLADIRNWTAHVAQQNQCNGELNETRISPGVRRLAYTNCGENADVILYTIGRGPHPARPRTPGGVDGRAYER